MTLEELTKIHSTLAQLSTLESTYEVDMVDEVNEAIDLVWREIKLKKLDPRKDKNVIDEAPTCEEHGTMVADNELGQSWHCAVCRRKNDAARVD